MKMTRLLPEMADYETAPKSRFLRIGAIGFEANNRKNLLDQCYQAARSVAEETVTDIGRELESDDLSEADMERLLAELSAVLQWHAPPFCRFGAYRAHEAARDSENPYGVWLDELLVGNADFGVIDHRDGRHDVDSDDVGIVEVNCDGTITTHSRNAAGQFEPDWGTA